MRRAGERISSDGARFGVSRRIRRIAAVVLALAVAMPSLAAANLFSNGEFSSGTVQPWRGSGGSLLWSNFDHAGNTGSGSARLTQGAGSFIASAMVSEKISVGGGKKIDLSGYFRTAGSPPSGASIQLELRYFSDGACTSYITAYRPGFVALSGSWSAKSVSNTSPSNARCVEIQIDIVDLTSPYGAFDLLADGLVLGGASTTLPAPIFNSGFESGNFSGWIKVD